EIAPAANVVGVLVNPSRPGVEFQEQELRRPAQAANRELVVLRPADARAIDAAFAALAEQNITALVVGADAFFNNNRQQIVGLAARYKILAIYPFREYP